MTFLKHFHCCASFQQTKRNEACIGSQTESLLLWGVRVRVRVRLYKKRSSFNRQLCRFIFGSSVPAREEVGITKCIIILTRQF